MTKSALPFLLAGGAALFFLGGKKKKTAPKTKSAAEIKQILSDLGYDDSNVEEAPARKDKVILRFQKDWNHMMMWLWEHNPNIDKYTPKYGVIAESGSWNPETDSRAARALANVPKGGTSIIIDDQEIPVNNFRDMVQKAYSATLNEGVEDQSLIDRLADRFKKDLG